MRAVNEGIHCEWALSSTRNNLACASERFRSG
jgi:hypothetical protein